LISWLVQDTKISNPKNQKSRATLSLLYSTSLLFSSLAKMNDQTGDGVAHSVVVPGPIYLGIQTGELVALHNTSYDRTEDCAPLAREKERSV
jgi:hypothetical protein